MNQEVLGVFLYQIQDFFCLQIYVIIGKRREFIECLYNIGYQIEYKDCQQVGNVGDFVKEILIQIMIN